MTRAREIMTLKPMVCREDDTIFEAVQYMKYEDCGAIPVVNAKDECIGIVTDRDICLYTILNKKNPQKTKIKDVMTKRPLTCHPDDDVERVVTKMEKQKVRRIPVVDDKKRCVGIISEGDIAVKDSKAHAGELVHAVCK